MFSGWKDVKRNPLSSVTKGNWATGKDGKYDAVPRQYLNAKADKVLEPKRKNPWED